MTCLAAGAAGFAVLAPRAGEPRAGEPRAGAPRVVPRAGEPLNPVRKQRKQERTKQKKKKKGSGQALNNEAENVSARNEEMRCPIVLDKYRARAGAGAAVGLRALDGAADAELAPRAAGAARPRAGAVAPARPRTAVPRAAPRMLDAPPRPRAGAVPTSP